MKINRNKNARNSALKYFECIPQTGYPYCQIFCSFGVAKEEQKEKKLTTKPFIQCTKFNSIHFTFTFQ